MSLRPFLCKFLGSESAPSAEFIPQVKPDVQFHPAGQFQMAVCFELKESGQLKQEAGHRLNPLYTTPAFIFSLSE